jgi:hypothetical protein
MRAGGEIEEGAVPAALTFRHRLDELWWEETALLANIDPNNRDAFTSEFFFFCPLARAVMSAVS